MTQTLRQHNPNRRDMLVFAALWIAFWMLLAWLASRGGNALLFAAAATGACWTASLALNRDIARRAQLPAVAFPLGLLSLWALPTLGASASAIIAVGTVLGLVGGILIVASPSAGRRIYAAWMQAALPIGWSFSCAILALVYFVLITPLGLAMRLITGDPMHRRFDRDAASYWTPYTMPKRRDRYFRQY